MVFELLGPGAPGVAQVYLVVLSMEPVALFFGVPVHLFRSRASRRSTADIEGLDARPFVKRLEANLPEHTLFPPGREAVPPLCSQSRRLPARAA